MKNLVLLNFIVLAFTVSIPAQSGKFWSSLQNICGKAFAGEIVHASGDDSFRGKELVMHVRSCEENEIKIPFVVGEDRSRTWILTKIGDRIRLKHDHRHEDGTSDKVTMYGGTTSNSGLIGRQVFPADEETQKLLPVAASNVWWIDLANNSFSYNLRRIGTDRYFSIRFDLTKEVEKPEAPWGWDKTVPRRITYNEKQDRYPSFSPEGGKILFESDRSGKWNIYEMNADGSDPGSLTDGASDSRYPSYAGSAPIIVFSKQDAEGFSLALVMRDGQKVSADLPKAVDVLFPTLSPIKLSISYTSNADILLKEQTETNPKRFVSTEFREAWLRWSPDEKKIAFFSRRDTNDEDDEIYIMDYPSGTPKRITNRKGHDFCPSWSPDGKRLAVAAVDEKLGRSINIIDLEGNILSRHGLGFERVTEPNWSPDGKQIIYTASREGNYDIYVESVR
ncbi:MAG: hypothetical protein R2681_17775 [Pyrinomonadaceae bacterium]